MTNIATGDPKAEAPQLFIPAGWKGPGQPPLYTAAQVEALSAARAADTDVLDAAMRAIQQAIQLIGEPTDERMRTVRRVLRGAVVVADDAAAPRPSPSPAPAEGNWIAADDVKRLVRELDVALNGKEGAAQQASLCDVVSQVVHEAAKLGRPLIPATPFARNAERTWDLLVFGAPPTKRITNDRYQNTEPEPEPERCRAGAVPVLWIERGQRR